MKGTIFVLLVTLGGSFAALFDPFIGAVVYIGFALLRPDALWGANVQGVSFIAGTAMLGGWFFAMFGNWRFGRGWPIIIGLLGYWLWITLAAAFADEPEAAWPFVLLITKIILAVLVGATTIRTPRQMKTLMWVIVIVEGYIAWEMNLSYYQGYNRAEDDGFGTMGRAVYATSLVATIWPAVLLTMTSKRLWQKGIAAVSTLLIFHTILLTFSRGGMLGLVVSAVIGFILLRKRPVHYALIVVALLIAVRLTGVEVVERFSSTFAPVDERDASAESRPKLWGNAFTLATEHPIVGLGPDGFPYKAPRFGWPLGKEAHSLWVQTLAETGFPGLFFLVLFYGGGVPSLIHLARTKPRDDDEAWLVWCAWMTVSSLAGFVAAAQFVSVARMEASYYIAMFGAATLAIHSAAKAKAPAEQQATVSAGGLPMPQWQGAGKV
jgi:O-antigen ligase